MAKIVVLRGLTESEYEEVKKALPGFATVRIHSEKYCYRAIDIRPRKESGYQFTPEQFNLLRSFVNERGLIDTTPAIFNGQNGFYCYGSGINYLFKESK